MGSIVKKGVLIGLLLVLVVGGLWYVDMKKAPKREAYSKLALCLTEQEAQFYGAFWCPYCSEQKTIFGSAAKKLPYIECSTNDRKEQTQECIDAGIESYPVWDFSNGMRCGGAISPETLAYLAGCAQPTYEGAEEQTVSGLYERLVVEKITNSMKKQRRTEEEVQEYIETARDAIDTFLQETHTTTLEETENIDHLLAAIAGTMHRCSDSEKAKN